MVWGQTSMKATKDIRDFQTVTLCVTAAARPPTVLGAGRYHVLAEGEGQCLGSSEPKCPRQKMN